MPAGFPPGYRRHLLLRALLLQTVAPVALLCLSDSSVLAGCTISGDTVTCDTSAPNPNPLLVLPPPATPSVTVNILGGATVNGMTVGPYETATITNNGNINGPPTTVTVTGPGNSVFDNNGSINGLVTIQNNATGNTFTFHQGGQMSSDLVMTGTGNNSLIVEANRSVNNVTMVGAENFVDNFGTTANNFMSLTATVSNHVINRAGAQMNANDFSGPLNEIDNSGRINSNLHFVAGNTRNVVFNRGSGTIAGGITSDGAAQDIVGNTGIINNNVNLGDGNDTFLNYAGEVGIATNDVILGGGDDIFWLTGGTLNGTVNFGTGNDRGFMSGGTITNVLQGGAGEDEFTWSGGTITTGINMGADDDHVIFDSLPSSSLNNFLPIDGGTGNDILTWDDTTGGNVARYLEWERIDLTNGSQMIFSDFATLTLGDTGGGAVTGTGALFIDSSSSVLAGGGTHTVAPSDNTQLVDVYNAGTIDLTNGQGTTTDRFQVLGNYDSQSGNLNLQTRLGSDGSPSDQLVIRGAGASASGITIINDTNLNGLGDMTTSDGIRVVDAVDGATTAGGSFVLGGPVAAGVFE